MKQKLILSILFSIFFTLANTNIMSQTIQKDNIQDTTKVNQQDKLVVVWTSGDKEVALKMVFMYTFNAKKYEWWNDITLLVWGPSAKLLSEDKELQKSVKEMMDIGVNVLACKGCADQYEVSDDLAALGITVKYTGKDLTDFIKERHVVTF